MSFISELKKIDKKDILMVGGKGASLGEMTHSGFKVPLGFVILTSAFERFLKESNVELAIIKIWKKIDFQDLASINRSSKSIKKIIEKVDIPNEIEKEIWNAFKKLKTKFVAVRSSATVEDSKLDSWAGELETYLNTTSKDLIKNIKKCWASLYTSRAMIYRFKRNLNKQSISVAVIVQKMIQSEVSGVCFTTNPVTKDRNQMIIESIWGLGEMLVSGQITPDAYEIDKLGMRILRINKNIQNRMLIKSGLGNKIAIVSKNKKERQKLSEKQIKELAKICCQIERYYGKPQDIEWALEKGKFYIVQSRPITTL